MAATADADPGAGAQSLEGAGGATLSGWLFERRDAMFVLATALFGAVDFPMQVRCGAVWCWCGAVVLWERGGAAVPHFLPRASSMCRASFARP
jgi:hypothetical protein